MCLYLICIFCLIVLIVVTTYSFLLMRKLSEVIKCFEEYFNDVVFPHLSLNETEYIKKEKTFDERINMLREELYNLPSTHPAEILDPLIYNIEYNPDEEYITIIEDEEVAE